MSYYAAITIKGNLQYLKRVVLEKHDTQPINFQELTYKEWLDILEVNDTMIAQFSKQDFCHGINTPLKNIREAAQESYI